jgi:hypothetical protein
MHKTGSTSIQRSFDGYDDGRLLYLDVGPNNHSFLMRNVFWRLTGQPLKRLGPGKPPEDPDLLQDRYLQNLRNDRRSLIVSGEFLSAPGFNDAAIPLFLSELGPHFDEIRAFAYVREPISLMRSRMQQRVRRMPVSFDLAEYYPSYRQRLQHWIKALGAEHVTLVPFVREAFCSGDLLTDFAARTGALGPVSRRASENPSLSSEAFAILFAMHRRIPNTQSDEGTAVLKHVFRAVRGYGSHPFEISPDLCRAIVEQNAEDVAWVEREMGHRLPPDRPSRNAVVFSSGTEVIDYAESLGVDLDALAEGKAFRMKTVRGRLKRKLKGAPGLR